MAAPERSSRSVYVGNIPYEATEEILKAIFQNVGPVVNFRIVYDRESGKPKGYGFCEYQDAETAQSAIRNLNNHDFNGRPLRVGAAAGDSVKDDMKMGPGGMPVQESPYGAEVAPPEVPEAISKAVASLPPEQMYELMKQMKLCIQNNPNEARNMLLQNPQLAYALLQAQIVMKIVDPQVAMAMLHRQTEQIPPLMPNKAPQDEAAGGSGGYGGPPADRRDFRGSMERGPGFGGPGDGPPDGFRGPSGRDAFSQERYGGGPPDRGGYGGEGYDDRWEQRGGPGPYDRRDPRGGPMPGRGGGRGPPGRGPHDYRGDGYRGDRDYGGPGGRGGRPDPRDHRDPRGGEPKGDPRGPPRPPQPPQRPAQPPTLPSNLAAGLAGTGGGSEQDKAALIMQVLQLSEEQIAMLPPDQRQSILILKQQVQRTGGH